MKDRPSDGDVLRMAGLSARERTILDALVAKEKVTISVEDLIDIQPSSRSSANQILSRLQRKGWLRRTKRGLYVLIPLGAIGPDQPIEEAWPLAMALFAPCYISGWTAAEHWDFTEQIFNTIAVVTAKPQRQATKTIAGVTFLTRTLHKEKIFGTKLIWLGSQQVEIADPHRLVVDILDDPRLGGGGRHTLDVVRAYWKSKHADPARLLEYAKRYGRGTVFKRLGFTAELCNAVDQNWLEDCRHRVTVGISNFDPSGSPKGKIISKWNLRINLPLDAQ